MNVLQSAAIVLLLAAFQNEQAAVVGTVTRYGTAEPLTNVQVTLEGGPIDPKVMQSILSTAANGGVVVTPSEGASLAEVTELLINAAVSRGLPNGSVAMRNLVSRTVGVGAWPAATSDRDGRFEFKGLRPGKYTVRAQRDGYFGKASGGTYPRIASVDVTVTENKAHEVPVALIPGTNISGRIYDTSGVPLANANVAAFTLAYVQGMAVLQQAATKVTDDRGEYRLVWVPPGTYYIGATPRTPGARTYYPGVTRFSDAKAVTTSGGEDLSAMDISMRAGPGFKVSGQITSRLPPVANQPTASNAFLEFNSSDLNASSDPSAAMRIISLASGKFELLNMKPGVYDLFARVADPSRTGPLQNAAWGRTVVEVRDVDVSGVAITIERTTDLLGTVMMVGNAAVPSNIRIVLLPDGTPAKIPLINLVSTRASIVNADGSFTVGAVPPGRFRVGALAGLPPSMYIADVRRSAQTVFDSGFEVNPKASDPIEIVVGTGAAMVTGIVRDGPLKSTSGATVVLIPEERKRENRALYLTATSDASGRFQIQGVAPGSYKVFSWESIPANAFMNAEFLAPFEDRGKTVRIGQSGSIDVDLTVIR